MLYRIVRMSGTYYATWMEDLEELQEESVNIEALALSGNIVFIVDELDSFADEMEIRVKDIAIVED